MSSIQELCINHSFGRGSVTAFLSIQLGAQAPPFQSFRKKSACEPEQGLNTWVFLERLKYFSTQTQHVTQIIGQCVKSSVKSVKKFPSSYTIEKYQIPNSLAAKVLPLVAVAPAHQEWQSTTKTDSRTTCSSLDCSLLRYITALCSEAMWSKAMREMSTQPRILIAYPQRGSAGPLAAEKNGMSTGKGFQTFISYHWPHHQRSSTFLSRAGEGKVYHTWEEEPSLEVSKQDMQPWRVLLNSQVTPVY